MFKYRWHSKAKCLTRRWNQNLRISFISQRKIEKTQTNDKLTRKIKSPWIKVKINEINLWNPNVPRSNPCYFLMTFLRKADFLMQHEWKLINGALNAVEYSRWQKYIDREQQKMTKAAAKKNHERYFNWHNWRKAAVFQTLAPVNSFQSVGYSCISKCSHMFKAIILARRNS